jgi:hypothetical protein
VVARHVVFTGGTDTMERPGKKEGQEGGKGHERRWQNGPREGSGQFAAAAEASSECYQTPWFTCSRRREEAVTMTPGDERKKKKKRRGERKALEEMQRDAWRG